MSNSLACSHSLLPCFKSEWIIHTETTPAEIPAYLGVFWFCLLVLFFFKQNIFWMAEPVPINAPTCACFKIDLSPAVFLVIPKLLCPIALIGVRSGRTTSVTSCHWQQRTVGEWRRQKQVALSRSWTPKLHLHMSHLSSHDPIISPSIETSPNRTCLIAPALQTFRLLIMLS